MPRLSEGLILHVRQHEIVRNYIIWTYSGTEEAVRTLAVKAEQKCVQIFGNGGRSEIWNYRSFAVRAEGKYGGRTSHIWQWRQSVSGEADLQIFGSQDWAKLQKRNCISLEVQAEMKCGNETSHLWKSWQNKCGKRNFRSFPVKAERMCGSRTSHSWQSRQSGSAEAELHIFGSQCRTKVRTWNFSSLAVKTAEAELQIFGNQGRAEVWKRNFRSLAVQTERKCGSSTAGLWQSSQLGRAEADLFIFDRPISYWLSLQMLKNNSTDCYIERQCEDHVRLKHMTFAMRVTRSI